MVNITINTQEEFDKLKEVKKEDDITVECEVRLNSILNVYGKILFKRRTDCSSTYGDRYVEARENSSVVAWGNSSVVARENSSVEAWGNSSVVARENSSVVAWGNSSVEAWGNSSVVARGNSVVRLFSDLSKVVLHGFSVLFKNIDLKVKVSIKSKNVKIQTTKLLPYLEREGIKITKGKVILYKKVSKEFKTQEGKPNETDWKIGSTLEHKNYEPTKEECGEGKFHACSKPYFCDEFRNEKGDRYIAIEVNKKDLYEWKKPAYPHKIAFRKCNVLYECNKFGKEIKL